MSQQINLFDPGFRKPRRVLSAATILLAIATVAAVLGGYGLYARQHLVHSESALRQANADFKRLTEDLAKVGSRPLPVASQALIDEIAGAEALAGARRALAEMLKGGGIGNTQGYSVYLAALARQHAEGVWLTGISLAEGGSEFLIHGRAVRAELVPVYLDLLNREESLRGRVISEMRLLEREQEAPAGTAAPKGPGAPALRYIDFTIGSGATPAAPR